MSMDFIGFTYNGKHSFRDLNIYRTSNGSRYNDNLNATLTDKTADVPGGDGQYYFGTTKKNKTFSVSYAFDNLTESGLRLLKQTFDGKDIHDLIFDEEPYKVWSAKVTGTAQIKHLCFEESEGQRTYKGEGSITFTCYYPYAHTPNEKNAATAIDFTAGNELVCGLIIPKNSTINFVNATKYTLNYAKLENNFWKDCEDESSIDSDYIYFIKSITVDTISDDKTTKDFYIEINNKNYGYTSKGCFECLSRTDGRDINYYSIKDYPNKMEWALASGLKSTPVQGENYGDIPAHFIYSIEGTFSEGHEFKIGKESIVIQEYCKHIKWDSKTGIVLSKPLTRTNSGDKEGSERPIRYTGNSLATIPVSTNSTESTVPTEGILIYNYWYY